MQKELKNITENVMNQIQTGQVKMKPKLYFVLGSILTFLGLISSVVVSVFLMSLIRFSLRAHGPMGEYRFDQMMSNFPWWIIIFTIVSLFVGVLLIKQYDFSYKKEPWLIVLGFILAVLISGWVIDMVGINNRIIQRSPMRGMMNNYFQENNFPRQNNWQR